MVDKKGTTRKSPILTVGSEADSVEGFTKRVLMSLVVDVTELRRTTERLHIQVSTLAREHGIVPPDMNE